MAAPEFVPLPPVREAPVYQSPPRRPAPWLAERPGELFNGHGAAQPEGGPFGHPGPDQGYALRLAERFRGRLALAPGESEDDAIAGCVAVALRRASQFGRAPVIHDVRLALELFGFLDEEPDPDKVKFRAPLFEGVAHPHHYFEARQLASLVPTPTLRMSPEWVRSRRAEWRMLLGLS